MLRLTLLAGLCALAVPDSLPAAQAGGQARPPNIIIVCTDDQGYADIGSQGAQGFRTPHLDRLAAEGVRFTDFYVSSPVCSASRAALLTGCYHERVGISGALGPHSTAGLHPEETTIAELCRAQGYATAAVGKWHLGHLPEFLPTNQGFDSYFGLPYSNDMWPQHPGVRHLLPEERLQRWPHLPLIEGTRIIDAEITPQEQEQLTTRYTQKAVGFIRQNRDQPFFLYLAHSQPHVPLFVSANYKGKTERGLYGDVIAEIDWSMGEILKALDTFQISQNTLVLFTSDNGPWLSYGNHGGSAGPLREGKGTCWEGGIRVPFLARWPGRIPAGSVCREPAATIDLLPTIARAIGGTLPKKQLDGKDITPLLTGAPGATSPHAALFFYSGNRELHAVRSGRWKLMLSHSYRLLNGRPGGKGGMPVDYENRAITQPELYDLVADPGETRKCAADHPEVVAALLKKVEAMRVELGDTLTGREGTACRPPGTATR